MNKREKERVKEREIFARNYNYIILKSSLKREYSKTLLYI